MSQNPSHDSILLQAALPHIPFDGWTATALERGANDAGISFTKNINSIDLYIDLFIDSLINGMKKSLAAQPVASMKLSEKIESAVMAYLHAALPHREAMRKALAHDAIPTNAAQGTARLYRVVDAIWRAAGDHPTDFSFYTKRLSLAAIFAATQLCWLGDETNDLSDTRAFLKRRMENLFAFHRTKQKIQTAFKNLPFFQH